MSTVTKPIALDETLQSTNTALGSLGKDTTLQAIATAIANVGLSNIGNMSSLATTDKTSLVSAINEVVGDVSDLDIDKADKVTSATSGNLAGLNANGNLTDSGWDGAKTTTSASGNPISITGLKSNQLAVNPVITFEPIQAGSGDPSPSNVRAISGYDKIEVLSCGVNVWNEEWELGTYSTTDGSPVSGTSNIRSKPNKPIIVEGNTKYYSRISLGGRLFFYDSADQYINNTTTANNEFTTPANAKYLRFHVSTDYGTKYNNNISINYPSTQTSYEPCNKTTDLSEPLPQTVYGGQEVVRTGVLTSTMTNVDLSTLSWIYVSNYNCWRAVLSVAKVSSNDSPINGKADRYVIVKAEGYVQSHSSNTLAVSTSDYIFIDNGSTTTSPTGQLVCELKTPIKIQLTPHEISLLKDYAYVSTNGTSIALDYHNGEIATLGDVSQLGETVNELGDYLNDLLICKTKVFSNTGSVAAGNYKIMQEDISSNVPNGYKCIGALPLYSGDDGFVWVECVFVPSTNQVTVMIRNVGTSADSGTPQVGLLCIRV